MAVLPRPGARPTAVASAPVGGAPERDHRPLLRPVPSHAHLRGVACLFVGGVLGFLFRLAPGPPRFRRDHVVDTRRRAQLRRSRPSSLLHLTPLASAERATPATTPHAGRASTVPPARPPRKPAPVAPARRLTALSGGGAARALPANAALPTARRNWRPTNASSLRLHSLPGLPGHRLQPDRSSNTTRRERNTGGGAGSKRCASGVHAVKRPGRTSPPTPTAASHQGGQAQLMNDDSPCAERGLARPDHNSAQPTKGVPVPVVTQQDHSPPPCAPSRAPKAVPISSSVFICGECRRPLSTFLHLPFTYFTSPSRRLHDPPPPPRFTSGTRTPLPEAATPTNVMRNTGTPVLPLARRAIVYPGALPLVLRRSTKSRTDPRVQLEHLISDSLE
jgi:hypothetical protein